MEELNASVGQTAHLDRGNRRTAQWKQNRIHHQSEVAGCRASILLRSRLKVPIYSLLSPHLAQAGTGTAKYAPEKDAIVWTIKQFPGQKEFLLRAHFGLPSVQQDGRSFLGPSCLNYFAVRSTPEETDIRQLLARSLAQLVDATGAIPQNHGEERLPGVLLLLVSCRSLTFACAGAAVGTAGVPVRSPAVISPYQFRRLSPTDGPSPSRTARGGQPVSPGVRHRTDAVITESWHRSPTASPTMRYRSSPAAGRTDPVVSARPGRGGSWPPRAVQSLLTVAEVRVAQVPADSARRLSAA
eukprot:766468-Hanusia_phi.AAC.1